MNRRWSQEHSTWSVIALIKGSHRFVFVYDEVSRDALIHELRCRAADPDSLINWQDVTAITQRIRQATANGSQPGEVVSGPAPGLTINDPDDGSDSFGNSDAEVS
ncbi:MAG: hypothetical protein NZ703_07525 [Gemmataceae bacterium]|nr:hypothetical protein [Gemmataceae bacterium]